jgi:hypothetical protein
MANGDLEKKCLCILLLIFMYIEYKARSKNLGPLVDICANFTMSE